MGLLQSLTSKLSKKIEVFAPMKGEVVALSDVPDEAMASGAIGDGLAINPEGEGVFAPLNAPVAHCFETNHALLFEVSGLELIVHFGVDTVKLKGEGFQRIVENNTSVKKGDLLMKYDLDFMKKNAKSVLSPIIISNMEVVKTIEKTTKKRVEVGELLYTVTLK